MWKAVEISRIGEILKKGTRISFVVGSGEGGETVRKHWPILTKEEERWET